VHIIAMMAETHYSAIFHISFLNTELTIVLDDLDELCDRPLFFVVLDFYDQTLFDGPYLIFFLGHKRCIEISAYQFPNGFHQYLSFLAPCPNCV
jgi:hypothetical protein